MFERSSALVLVLVLAGCTSSLAARQDLRPPEGAALTGAPYSLPMLQYDLKITRTLAQCTDPVTKKPSLKFAMTVEATPRYPAGETYVIDYRQLGGWTKTTDFAIEFQDNSNILKSINATVEDRTAEIASNVVKSAVGVASLINGIPVASGAPGNRVQHGMMVCAPGPDGAQAKLDAIKVATNDVKDKTPKLKAATAAVDALSSRSSSLSDSDRTALTKKVAAQATAVKALAASQEALDERTSNLSYVEKATWPRKFADTDGVLEVAGPGLAKLTALVGWAQADGSPNASENQCDDGTKLDQCVAKKLGAMITLSPDNDDERANAPAATAKNSPSVVVSGTAVEGVLVRPPVHGRLLVCAASDAGCSEDSDKLVFHGDDAAIPQLGSLRFLPFRNEAFQNNALTLVLTPSGDLSKVEYKNLKAQGEVLSGAVLSAVNDVRGFADSVKKERSAETKQSHDDLVAERADEIAAIQFEIDKAKKQKELADATQPADAAGIAPIEAQTAQLKAHIALLQAELQDRQAAAALQQ
jgi:hypothetical protein